MHTDSLVWRVNQIGSFFEARPDLTEALKASRSTSASSGEPRMRREFLLTGSVRRQCRGINRRNMGRDDFPAQPGQARPGLALAPDQGRVTDFESQIDRGEIMPKRQNV